MCAMSEISKDLITSTEMDMDMEMDLFKYYVCGIEELMMSKDDFSPSSLTNSRLVKVGNGSFRNREVGKEGDGCNERNRPVGFGSLFCNAVGDGLSAHKKDRLMTMLCRTAVALNEEVNEVLDPVLSMLRLRRLLAPEKSCGSYQDGNDKVEFEEREPKRRKVNDLTEEGSLSEKKGVVEHEPGKCKSLTRCNNTGCEKYNQKRSFDEIKSCRDCSKHSMNESLLGSNSRDNKENGEVNDAIQYLLENRGPKVAETMVKHSAELSATLEHMKGKLEELLDIVVSDCRAMTLPEKHQLKKLVQNLDPQSLDRVVGIIQRGKPPEQQSRDDIIVDLQNENNSTLWRIYFHVKAVENAKKRFVS